MIDNRQCEQWHRENLAIHPNHYSSMARMMGPAAIRRCQEEWGARLYFNTLVPWGQGMIKYGVINRKDLLVDLVDWETLYVAGRLHKPVNTLKSEVLVNNFNPGIKRRAQTGWPKTLESFISFLVTTLLHSTMYK